MLVVLESMWEEAPLQVQGDATIVVKMVIGPGTARPETGRTSVIDVGRGVTLRETVAAVQGTMEVGHALAQDLCRWGGGAVAEATAEVAVTAHLQGEKVAILMDQSVDLGVEAVVHLLSWPDRKGAAFLVALQEMAGVLKRMLGGVLVRVQFVM